MLSVVKKFIGSGSSHDIKRLNKLVIEINALEQAYEKLSDIEIQNKTKELKDRIHNQKDDIRAEAFALVREASKRVLGQRHYDVQLLGGLVLIEGNISEMQTGEGKTLVASLPSFYLALYGKGVHVITVNEYLAKRDFETIGRIHEYLGLSVGLNISQLEATEKQQAYQADITYGTGNEFGFDYLRDHMVQDSSEKVQRALSYAIIDEIDSILIDEARTPLIIANKSNLSAGLFKIVAMIVSSFQEKVDYELYKDTKQIVLLDSGAEKIEKAFGLSNLYEAEHQLLFHMVTQSLRAHFIMRNDVDYIVKEEKVQLVDSFTGRIMEGRTYSEGLHQAIEAKEGIEVKEENNTQASVTIQNYFRLYTHLCGMTGTAYTERGEFWNTYGINVVIIPTNKTRARIDLEDMIYIDNKFKNQCLLEEVTKYNRIGKPVLIGTTSIEQSEEISELLTKNGLKHQLLNAKSEELEAGMIALAGQKGHIMIATNMAGRGTDILLGEGVAELGGLHIIGTQRHESRRIDNQLRGRAGRQGDPGTTQFIVSLEDDLLKGYDKDELQKYMKKVKADDKGRITTPSINKFMDKVQESTEGIYASSRSHLLKLDDVLNAQRKRVYEQRNILLESSEPEILLVQLMENYLKAETDEFLTSVKDNHIEEAKQAFNESVLQILPIANIDREEIEHLDKIELHEMVEDAFQPIKTFILEETDNVMAYRSIMLRLLDSLWIEHLEKMERLKEGIHLQSYGQEDPYRTFEKEGFYLFQEFQMTFAQQVLILTQKQIQQLKLQEEKQEIGG
ncbi:preprotein translocase subunit SecA [Fictibacillus sp. 23RED33]|uniref:preprotein translocase subunit SecA n=1 Tax=Fictibacillus sp. 23RED33 TaxID=2745879 RepID=UPI0018CF31A4|nr:preprotein translocase subunit SecA [Fictibacillus sp. 23RED33]MBH0173793.1 preprotein translocase subunit SecA [Fictibacillus sp. 23RED33]